MVRKVLFQSVRASDQRTCGNPAVTKDQATQNGVPFSIVRRQNSFLYEGWWRLFASTLPKFKGRKEDFSIRPIIFYVLKIEITITSITTLVLIFFRTEIADYFFSPGESFFFFLTALGLIPGIITAIFSAAIEGIQKFEFFT